MKVKKMIFMISRKEKNFFIFLIVSFVMLLIASSLKNGSLYFSFNAFMTLLVTNFCYDSCLFFDMI